jgi:hypothetical protein
VLKMTYSCTVRAQQYLGLGTKNNQLAAQIVGAGLRSREPGHLTDVAPRRVVGQVNNVQ